MKTEIVEITWAKKTGIKIGDTVAVYVSPDEPRRRIKIEAIHESYKGDKHDGMIEGRTPQGHWAWARQSQIIKLNSNLRYR